MNGQGNRERVLALYPVTRGLAFVLFSHALTLDDWGLRHVRGSEKNDRCLTAVVRLIERHRPTHVVIEDASVRGSRRNPRIRKLYRAIASTATLRGVKVCRFSQEQVKVCFRPLKGHTKYRIAKAVAQQLPAIGHRLPPPRRAWMSVDPRQSLFDAAALGLTYFRWRGFEFPPENKIEF